MRRRIPGFVFALAGLLIGSAASAIEFDESTYEVYYGDFNNDGNAGDVYIHEKDRFVLLHGDIAIPLIFPADTSFVLYGGGDDTAHFLPLLKSQLTSYMLANIDTYYFADMDGDGYLDMVVFDVPGNNRTYTFFGDTSSVPTITSTVEPVPVAVTNKYVYDALGRLTRVYEDGGIKTGYCYDDAGNRTTVTAHGGGGDDCDSVLPIQPPGSLSVVTHAGSGYTVSWGIVEGATYYKLKFGNNSDLVVNNPNQTTYSTGSNTLDDEPVWIQACDNVGCSANVYF